MLSPLNASAVMAPLGWNDPRADLRDELKAEFFAPEVRLTDSGTSALLLALRFAAEVRPDAPCVLPAYGCYDLATAAIGAGVEIRLYDVDPRTLGPDLASLEFAVRGAAAAIVIVHLFGVPVEVSDVRALAQQSGALVIEDAAMGSGGTYGGAALGAHGDVSVLSFNRGKGVTGGSGGALLLRSPEPDDSGPARRLAHAHSRPLRASVSLAAQWILSRPSLYALPAGLPWLGLGSTRYRAPSEPREMSAAVARVLVRTRPLATDEISSRRVHAERLGCALARIRPELSISPPAGGVCGFLRLPLVLPEGCPRNHRVESRLGIISGYPTPLSELPALTPHLRESIPVPGASRLARQLVTLPTHSALAEQDLLALERWVADSIL